MAIDAATEKQLTSAKVGERVRIVGGSGEGDLLRIHARGIWLWVRISDGQCLTTSEVIRFCNRFSYSLVFVA